MEPKRNYLNESLCAECGGRCCKGMPGSAFPSDFQPQIAENVKKALSSGRWAIDWWEGDPRPFVTERQYYAGFQDFAGHVSEGYFLRPAIKGMEGRLRHASWGGECTFLGPLGCELDPLDRPKDCRMMEPLPTGTKGGCKFHRLQPKRSAAIAWIPFRSLLQG